MNLCNIVKWITRDVLERMAELKHAFSPEFFACLANGGHVEAGARVYTQFSGTISFGAGVRVGRDSVISNHDKPGLIRIGSGTSVGWNNNFYGMAGIDIGENVLFASNVCILTSNHGWKDLSLPIAAQPSSYAPVSIGDNCWIGYNVIILPGVHIGRHVVVGAGSVVTHDMPDYSVCAGSPCRVIHYSYDVKNQSEFQ